LVKHGEETEKIRLFSVASATMGLGVCLLAATGFCGWLFDAGFLRSLFPDWASMKPNTSLGLFLSGVLLAATWMDQRSPALAVISAAGAVLLLLLGGVTLLEYFTGWNAGIDSFLFHEKVQHLKGPHPGRMSPSSALSFFLAGLAFWAGIPGKKQEWTYVLQAMAGALILIGGFPLTGYVADLVAGYKGWAYTGMAIHTAVAFILLGAGLMCKVLGREGTSWHLDRTISLGFALAVIVMILSVNVAYHFAAKMQKTAALVEHRQQVLREVQQLAGELGEIESSLRGYLITGNASLLERIPENRERVREEFLTLKQETSDNPVQQANLGELEGLIERKNQWDERAAAERQQKGFPEASRMVATGTGLELWQSIRLQFIKMRNEEYRLIERDRAEVESSSALTFLFLPLGGFLSLTMILAGVCFLNGGMKERILAEERLKISLAEGRRSEEALREREKQLVTVTANLPGLVAQLDRDLRYRFVNATYEKWFGVSTHELLGRKMEDLIGKDAFERAEPHAKKALEGCRVDFENQVHTRNEGKLSLLVTFIPARNSEGHLDGLYVVAMDITRLKGAEEEILKLNASLEQRVKSRTMELEMANKELEAFSYSVSHDLRAPLRTVDGFSQAVMEDYGNLLPENGRRYLELVRGGAQKMGMLIDDLLTFSRLSRLPLSRDKINMNRIVDECLTELGLAKQQETRKIRMEIAPLPPGQGDPALIKQVWINFISNALKYSRKCEEAVIRIGCQEENGEEVYFIKDNGTGFDMRYASKLFGVFQRLHRAEDYEGTGVGLAIVQRVIFRHGGRVWADSKPGEGASFYFTMGEKI